MSNCEDDYRETIRQFQEYIVQTCAICKSTHFARLPKQKDFELLSYSTSSRLKTFHRYNYSFWVFKNFSEEVFYRTVLKPIVWYFQPENCERVQACNHTAAVLETFFGPFVNISSYERHEKLFRGYTFERMADGSVTVQFSDTLFETLNRQAERTASAPNVSRCDTRRFSMPSPLNQRGPEPTPKDSSADGLSALDHSSTKRSSSFGSAAAIPAAVEKPLPANVNVLANQTTACSQSLDEANRVNDVRASTQNVDRGNSEERFKNEQMLGDLDKQNEKDFFAQVRDIDKMPTDKQRPVSPDETMDSSSEGKVDSDYEKRVHGNAEQYKTETFTSAPEDKDYEENSLSGCEYLPLKQDDNLADSKTGNDHTPSTPDLSKVDMLGLDPNSSTSSCCKKNCHCLAQESMLPLNASMRQQGQTKQNQYLDKPAWKGSTTQMYNNPVEVEFKTGPQTSENSSILDSLKTKAKEVWYGQFSKKLEVFSHTRNAFADSQTPNWKEKFPFFYPFHRMLPSAVFDFTIEQDGKIYERCQNILTQMNTCPKKEILILASPGFGKTTLCYMIAYRWVSNVLGSAALCIRCFLPDVIDYAPDLSEAIVFYCKMILAGKVSDLELIRNALTKYSEGIILLLDGYDQLAENNKREVCKFLKRKDVFQKSTIVVTSRPTADEKFMRIFDRRVFINGFSKYSLKKSMENIDVPGKTIKRFQNTIQEEKFAYLSELSPLFTLYAAKTIRDSYDSLQEFDSLYSLVGNVIVSMITRKIPEAVDLDNCVELLQFVGKKCFENLVFGQRDFDELFLKETFGRLFTILLECNIFYAHSDTNNTKTYRTSGKVLQVFLAKMYLQDVWSETTNHEKFLEENFCLNGCSGDFVSVSSEKGDPSMYYVGLIPEIVLKVHKDKPIKDATFEMYYDVDRVEHSHAFDSVNLLLRVREKYLSRYRFTRVERDDEIRVLENIFGDVLNLMPTETFSVQHFFYSNSYEEKGFLKIVLREDEETDAALHEVVRANCKSTVERIHINFAFEKLGDIFPFVSAQLARYLDQFSLHPKLKIGSTEDLVFELVVQLLESRNICTAVVKCNSRDVLAKKTDQIICTFEISRQHNGNICNVFFSYIGVYSHSFWVDKKTYQKADFVQNVASIKGFMRDNDFTSLISRIVIDISLQ